MKVNSVILPFLLLAACGSNVDNALPENIGTEIISETPVENTLVNKPIEPGTETGSLEKPSIRKQEHPRHMYAKGISVYEPLQVVLVGESAESWLDIKLAEPPLDLTPCNNGIILTEEASKIIAEEYQYNSWWLVASKSSIGINWQDKNAIYLYWAKQVSDTEVGLVPIKENYTLQELGNIKINTGFAQLPYQWINYLNRYTGIPTNPEQPCIK